MMMWHDIGIIKSIGNKKITKEFQIMKGQFKASNRLTSKVDGGPFFLVELILGLNIKIVQNSCGKNIYAQNQI